MRKALRIIDASLNRSSEGLRVCEDIARFALNDRSLTRSLKKAREDALRLAKRIERSSGTKSFKFRNTLKDVGKKSSPRELKRQTLCDVFRANAQRAKESLRSLEEISKLLDECVSQKFKELRFKVYELEKRSRGKLESLLDN